MRGSHSVPWGHFLFPGYPDHPLTLPASCRENEGPEAQRGPGPCPQTCSPPVSRLKLNSGLPAPSPHSVPVQSLSSHLGIRKDLKPGSPGPLPPQQEGDPEPVGQVGSGWHRAIPGAP